MRSTVMRELQVLADRHRIESRWARLDFPYGSLEEGGEELIAGCRRVHRETVIVADDCIWIGVPTGECDLVPLRGPAG